MELQSKPVHVGLLMLLLISILTFSYKTNEVNAYKSGPYATHQFIFEQARTILQNDGYQSYADFLNSVEPSSGLTYLQIMIKGSDENDGLVAAREHYMDPTDHHPLSYMGIPAGKNAGQLCQERFDEAVLRWQSSDYYNAIYNLGWAAHLVQDVCVPHHAYPTWQQGHDTYELWVLDNMALFAVNNGGLYSFTSFPDYQFYTPQHFVGENPSAFDWVDYNAHESIKYWGYVNYYGTYNSIDPVVNDWAENDYFIETIHNLPNNVNTTWVVNQPGSTQIKIHFQTINLEANFDYLYILDGNNNVIQTFTGYHSDVWSTAVTGDTLKIRVTTDYSVESWGYKTDSIKFFDMTHDLNFATSHLLSLAQRTTAGFIKFFFDKVLNPVQIRSNGSVDPPTVPIQRNGDIYTFTSNLYRPVVVEKDNIIINGNGYTLQAIHNVGDGFFLSGRNNVTIQNVTIKGFWSGIFVWNSTHITVTDNIVKNNRHGLRIYHSNENTVASNTLIDNNGYAVVITNSSENTITYNNIISNELSAIYLVSSLDNKITRNNLIQNGWDGVWLSSSSNNTVAENEIRKNTWGIYLSGSMGNVISHNNLINNTVQVYCWNSANIWDYSYPSGGNYWSDYTGVDLYSGPSQDQPGSDGIGDMPYIINENNTDHYPLIRQYGPVHNINTGLHYASIQEAINANETQDGHTIFVESGIYYENLVVNKSVVLLGENKENTIIDGTGKGAAINVTSNNAVIKNFTIRNADSGIYIFNEFNNITVQGTKIINNVDGIFIPSSSNNKIFGNEIESNTRFGIWIIGSCNNTLRNNNMSNNKYNFGVHGRELSEFIHDIDTSNRVDGKYVYYLTNEKDLVIDPLTFPNVGFLGIINSTNITVQNLSFKGNSKGLLFAYTNNSLITGNTIKDNYHGIDLIRSSHSIITANMVINNSDGIQIIHSSVNNTISKNLVTNNEAGGIVLFQASYCRISENNISKSFFGIFIHTSSSNVISGNNVTNNAYALQLWNSSNNKIFHNNFVDNSQQVYSKDSTNVWDYGYPSGGNYWSDYIGVDLYSGPYQNETGSDGIGDTPYVIDGNNTDRYPLKKPYPWPAHDIGITNITASRTVIGQGYTIDVTITTFNYGETLENFNLTVYANTTILTTLENINIENRNYTTITYTWNTTGFAKGNYTIWAYAWPVLGETDTADNTFIDGTVWVKWLYDNTGDGYCGIDDIVAVAEHFGTEPGGPPNSLGHYYHPIYDITCDDYIGIDDVVEIAEHFGETDP